MFIPYTPTYRYQSSPGNAQFVPSEESDRRRNACGGKDLFTPRNHTRLPVGAHNALHWTLNDDLLTLRAKYKDSSNFMKRHSDISLTELIRAHSAEYGFKTPDNGHEWCAYATYIITAPCAKVDATRAVHRIRAQEDSALRGCDW